MTEILKKYFKGDKIIWTIIFVLFVFSMLVVYSASGRLVFKYQGGNTTYYLFRHFRFLIFGLGITVVVHHIHYRYFSWLSQVLLFLSIILLVFTILMGITHNSATRWLTLPGGVNFQTSDLAKFALIMFIARVLSLKQESKAALNKAFKPIMLAVVAVCGLIFPENFSTAALLFLSSWTLMFIGRIDLKYLLGSVGAIALIVVIFMMIAPEGSRVGTWRNRVVSFVQGEGDGSYQADQAKIAIVTGGFLGKGPGKSTQRNFLPQAFSDFIYAIIIEEYGLFGASVTLFLYLILLYRTGLIVKRMERTFPAFLAIGLVLSLVFQAFVNMAVAVSIIPVTGQPLPMVSMGGTSIIFTSVALGIVLNISTISANSELEADAEENYEYEEQTI